MPTPSETKIVFFGTPEFAATALEGLVQAEYRIVGVITQPSKPTGRKKEIIPSAVKEYALTQNLRVLEPTTLKNDEIFEEFKNIKPDLCIVAVYGKIIPQRFLDVSRFGFVNIHPSLLPKYRGPSPIKSAILEGEKISGTSIMIVDAEVDHGPVLSQKEYAIPENAYHDQIRDELAVLSIGVLLETLPTYIEGSLKAKDQDHTQATFTKMFSRDDGRINWHDSIQNIYNKIRALSTEPGTWTTYQGKTLRVHRVFPIHSIPSHTPGTVIKREKEILVAAADGYIRLESIQLEGKKETDAKSFANGYPDFIGSVLE